MTAEIYATVGDVTVEMVDAAWEEQERQVEARRAALFLHPDHPSRRYGKTRLCQMIAIKAALKMIEPLRLGPIRPAKHWVERRDWEQRKPRRRR